MSHDATLNALIRDCHALADKFAAEKADIRYAHVMNAVLDLRRAYSDEHQKDMAQADLQNLERMKKLRKPYA